MAFSDRMSLLLSINLGSPAVNEQFDTGDETGVIGREKQRHLRNFLRFPMRPIGMVDTIRAITSQTAIRQRRVDRPGLTTFERIRRSFRSVVQVRTNDRSAALLAA